ncbi:MAG: hypothetical protein HQL84_11350 [Magnetococcales bacterium]|nr:hypothetical protein [Magnetococcales bacterium]MBF0150630.1 hypothetical protein [Magnetococcales bacterium]MBF0630447.1 hypothetical protein [Magnetococcales bacterium]
MAKGKEVAPPQGSSDKAFGLVFAVFFLIVVLFPLKHQAQANLWALIPAAGFALLALVRPQLLRPLNQAWTRFGMILHYIMTPIVMSLIFLVTVTPIGLLMRLTGQRPLALKYDPKAESYWIARTNPSPDSMKHQF